MFKSTILNLSLLATIVSLMFLALDGYRSANLVQLLFCPLLFALAIFSYSKIKKKWR